MPGLSAASLQSLCKIKWLLKLGWGWCYIHSNTNHKVSNSSYRNPHSYDRMWKQRTYTRDRRCSMRQVIILWLSCACLDLDGFSVLSIIWVCMKNLCKIGLLIYMYYLYFFCCRLDPIIVNVPAPGVKLSCLTFAKNSDVSWDVLLFNMNYLFVGLRIFVLLSLGWIDTIDSNKEWKSVKLTHIF